jgi:Gas vesicle protein
VSERPPAAGGAAELVEVVAGADGSLLELVDHLLNQGVVLTGEVVLGLADIDLIYLRLSALLCAADRILPRPGEEEGGT